MYYSTILDSLIRSLDGQITRTKQELKELPEGRLTRAARARKTYYYQHLPPHGFRKTARRKGITEEEDLIHQLARKRYVEVEQDLARRNMQVLKDARQQYQPVEPAAIRDLLGKSYDLLPPHMFTPLITASQLWATDPGYRPEGRIQTSPGGISVRSKSELVIEGRFEHFGVEAIYEQRIWIDKYHLHPDFTIRRRTDGETIYWEHAGGMSEEKYRRDHKWRMQIYEDNGIVPWKNLIVTYDDEDGGLDARIVDALIIGWQL